MDQEKAQNEKESDQTTDSEDDQQPTKGRMEENTICFEKWSPLLLLPDLVVDSSDYTYQEFLSVLANLEEAQLELVEVCDLLKLYY